MSKIGIFSGTFDPVHKGHVSFALEAAKTAGLDKVYFLPEAVPRRHSGVTHYAHRVAMLRLAIKPYKSLGILDLPDKQFSVNRTLPRLQKKFPDADLHLLLGSDVVQYLGSGAWPSTDTLLKSMKLVVGMRTGEDTDLMIASLQDLVPDRSFHIVMTNAPHASSSDVRAALQRGDSHDNALISLEKYIKQNWLYEVVPS